MTTRAREKLSAVPSVSRDNLGNCPEDKNTSLLVGRPYSLMHSLENQLGNKLPQFWNMKYYFKMRLGSPCDNFIADDLEENCSPQGIAD